MYRMKLSPLCILAVLFASVALSQDGGLRYKLTDLQGSWMQGNCTGSCPVTGSWANAINTSGSVTGDYVDSNGNQYCFVYYNNGRFPPTHTTFSSSDFYCDARGINGVGAVGGTMGLLEAHAFLHTGNNVITMFNPFGSNGLGIDDYNDVIGDVYESPSGQVDPYRWNSNGGTSLRGPGMSIFTLAASTSPNGSLVLMQEGAGRIVPYYGSWTIWPSDSPIVSDSCSTTNPLLFANQINANGHVVGMMLCSDGFWHAALWMTPGLAPIDLGFPTSQAYGISSDDWVVGTSTAWSGGVGTLRVSDPSCPVPINLNTVLDSSGAGWTVVTAYGINTAHQIVGQARNSSGQNHAVLLTLANTLPLCHSQ